MSNKVTQLQDIKESNEKINGLVIGTLEGLDPRGWATVVWQSMSGDKNKLTVSSIRTMDKPLLPEDTGRQVILGFENGDPQHPVFMGFLNQSPAYEKVELAPDNAPGVDATEELPKSLHLKSEEELILECGKAKISLRADGRIVILGGYVVSRSTGVNKIKGGSVQIN